MVETTVVRTIRVKGTSEGVDKLTGDLNKLAGAQENVAVVSENQAKRFLSVEQAYKRQTMAVDENARAQSRIAKETKIAQDYFKQTGGDQALLAERIDLITKRYGVAVQATQQLGTQTGLARHELINLGRQAQDVGVSLISGQSPFMVLAQQGSQIADVFISSGKSVGSFFTQAAGWAKGFLTSTTGIVSGIAAIGAAAVYAAYQFSNSQKTVNEVLEEENRLLKEGKALVDARTSAEARASLQSRSQTAFETLRNTLDLQIKLNSAMEEAAAISQSRATMPTQVAGEMGEAPTGFAARSGPGMAEMTAAFERLKAAQDAGLPGLKAYIAALSEIGLTHPALAQVVEQMIRVSAQGLQIEQASLRAKALQDHLAGVATNAQLAAVGLGSIAQLSFNNLRAEEAKAATEAMAVAALELAKIYPNVSISTAQTLAQLQMQLPVAQAITGQAQLQAQYELDIFNAKQQGKPLTDAMALAEAQRAVALAQVNTSAQQRLLSAQNEAALIKATSDEERERIQANQTLNALVAQGVEYSQAALIAEQERANAAERRAQAEYDANLKAMEQAQTEKQRAREAKSIAEHDEEFFASERRRMGETAEHAESYADAVDRAQKSMRQTEQASTEAWLAWKGMQNIWETMKLEGIWGSFSIPLMNPAEEGKDVWWKGGRLTQFRPEGYTSTFANPAMSGLEQMYGAGGFDPMTGQPNEQGLAKVANTQFGKLLESSGGDISKVVDDILNQGKLDNAATVSLLNRSIELLSPEKQISAVQREIGLLQQQPMSLETLEQIDQLNSKLEQLTDAVNNNTDATKSMTDVLSPFYSSDPRRTYLGFRAFAGGGIMTDQGAMPLQSGIAHSRQVAVFGEGSTPEAFVPVPTGQIPVEIRQPANSNRRSDRGINVTINVQGNADAGTVQALKTTAFQQAQAMRRAMGG